MPGAIITEYGREVVHGGGSLLGFPGGTRTLAPENTSILVHEARHYARAKIYPRILTS